MFNTTILFTLVGGLALFFYGMSILTDGLQRIAGNELKKVLHKLTKSPLRGILVGASVTGIIQSSSATTVIVVGFINAHLMTLKQAIGIIFGANIGTTITAQIIAFKITKYSLPAIAIGVFLQLFVTNRRIKKYAELFIGFGLIFFGIHLMSEAFVPLKHSESFKQLFVIFGQNPLIGIFTGAILTAIIQSSSASIGIVISLASVGLIDIYSAFALILGDNIGTTITAQLAAIKGSIGARRAAMVHTLFNLLGAAYMYIGLFIKVDGQPIFLYFINMITPGNVFAGENIARHIANSHSVFNILTTIIFFPLIPLFEKIVMKLIPGQDIFEKERFIDIDKISIPDIALEQATKEIHSMGKYAIKAVEKALSGLYTNKDILKKVMEMEKYVDDLQLRITLYIVKVQEKKLSEEQSKKASILLHVVNDMEKIGDYAENIAKLVTTLQEKNHIYPKDSIKKIQKMEEAVLKLVNLSLEALINIDKQAALESSDLEDKVDKMKSSFRKDQIKRLGKDCSIPAGIILVDIVSNLERVADHAYTISKLVLLEVLVE
ncbi:MAG: hypothetical protein A2Y40_09015 [Candidatus Margulisbacteria bacterium GWF2_35_9]|nr:MAG: hypothetical protein A2Y40_09015 [Candidatus Margulisbacteria bacterium GWF2_35_9]